MTPYVSAPRQGAFLPGRVAQLPTPRSFRISCGASRKRCVPCRLRNSSADFQSVFSLSLLPRSSPRAAVRVPRQYSHGTNRRVLCHGHRCSHVLCHLLRRAVDQRQRHRRQGRHRLADQRHPHRRLRPLQRPADHARHERRSRRHLHQHTDHPRLRHPRLSQCGLRLRAHHRH